MKIEQTWHDVFVPTGVSSLFCTGVFWTWEGPQNLVPARSHYRNQNQKSFFFVLNNLGQTSNKNWTIKFHNFTRQYLSSTVCFGNWATSDLGWSHSPLRLLLLGSWEWKNKGRDSKREGEGRGESERECARLFGDVSVRIAHFKLQPSNPRRQQRQRHADGVRPMSERSAVSLLLLLLPICFWLWWQLYSLQMDRVWCCLILWNG